MSPEDAIHFLKEVPPFQFLDADTLHRVVRKISVAAYPPQTVLLKQGGPPSDFLMIIRKGGVKVFLRTEEGDEVLTDYRGEGDLIGYLSLFSRDRSRANVVTVEDTECLLLDRGTMQELIDTHPAVRDFFHQSFLNKYLDRTFRTMHDRCLSPGHGNQLLLTTPVGELATHEIKLAPRDISIQEASALMTRNRISSLVLTDSGSRPAGIVTDRDLRDKVVTTGRDIRDPVATIMSTSLVSVGTREYCFEALLQMIRHNIHHLLVMDDGKVRGIITNHDIMMLQGTSPVTLARDIESQQTVEGIAQVAKKVDQLVALLIKEETKATGITKIISEINDKMIRKILEIAEEKYGKPPLPYCWLALGSEGRKEQTFKTDQDNALLHADPATPGEEESAREFFPGFTVFIRDSLVKCGFPVCPGGYMASNAHWCQPLHVWKKYFTSWIRTPTANALLRSLIFFDFRPLHGDFGLAEELRDYLVARLEGNKVFLGGLANTIIRNRPPIGFLKSFIVEKSGEHKDKLDLKLKGVAPLVDIVRLFALERGVKATATIDRIEALKDRHTIVKEHAEELVHAFEFIMFRRIQHQFRQVEEGREPDNFINPNTLSTLDKKLMRDAFQLIAKMQDMIIERYKPMIW
ncbi:MAG: DUF294 nucleotidyltransferase-like domain-containing protein [Alphaproteobacteria bacterium]|uniref:DUF294 nucleotidyltransferase-like domain-containing protein n=1 Tax=Candidatus Nitrobium versatile TaxID=2884831 RepID=A0A953J5L9_9BACT|nr:DUF294 nucleotidyltransferase-like domain-containing protein [Candidatus Nitrobium versatile]